MQSMWTGYVCGCSLSVRAHRQPHTEATSNRTELVLPRQGSTHKRKPPQIVATTGNKSCLLVEFPLFSYLINSFICDCFIGGTQDNELQWSFPNHDRWIRGSVTKCCSLPTEPRGEQQPTGPMHLDGTNCPRQVPKVSWAHEESQELPYSSAVTSTETLRAAIFGTQEVVSCAWHQKERAEYARPPARQLSWQVRTGRQAHKWTLVHSQPEDVRRAGDSVKNVSAVLH